MFVSGSVPQLSPEVPLWLGARGCGCGSRGEAGESEQAHRDAQGTAAAGGGVREDALRRLNTGTGREARKIHLQAPPFRLRSQRKTGMGGKARIRPSRLAGARLRHAWTPTAEDAKLHKGVP